MSRYADLHVHTNASDGVFSPSKVVEHAISLGFSAISITDHDAVSGIDEAVEAGRSAGIEVIPGVELSTEYEDKEIHILGYYFDYRNETLNRLIQDFRDFRVKRMEQMLAILRRLGCNLNEPELMKNSEEGAIGRVHLANAMVAAGFVSSINEAFDKYLAVGKPAYMKKAKLTPAQACSLIKQTKGVPVLAHPFLLKKDEWIPDFVRVGVEGIEGYYPGMSLMDIAHYSGMASKMGLLITGGSDCHQTGSKFLMGLVKVPYEHVEKLKKLADKRWDRQKI
jgi:3',5'-nucleoside bisphosphate phosphatase